MMNVFRRFRFRSNRSIRFYKYFLSYVLIVLILLSVTGVAVYSHFLQVFKEEVENANVAALMQVRDTMDVRFKEMQRIALQIAENQQLTPYALNNSGYDWYHSVNELNKYRFGNTFLSNLGIVLNRAPERRLFTADGVYQMHYFFNNVFRYEHWNEEEFVQTSASINRPLIRPVENISLNNGASRQRFATYLYPLPANTENPYATVVFFLNEQTVNDYVSPFLQKYNGAFFLVDEKDRPIVTAGGEWNAEELKAVWSRISAAQLQRQINSLVLQQSNYSVVKLPSTVNGWTYVTLIPSDKFLQPVQSTQQIITAVFVSLLFLGLVLSFLLANINYRKLRELVTIFGERAGDKATNGSGDEFDYLSDALRETTRHETMMARLNSRTGLLREKLLLSLLQGKSDRLYELDNLFEMSGVHFVHSHFKVMILEIDDAFAFQRGYSANMQDLLKFSVINVTEELIGEIGKGFGIDLAEERGIAVVMNIPKMSDEDSEIRGIAVKIQQFFKSYYKFSLSIGIGRSCQQLDELRSSFVDAERALYYRFLKGNEQVLIYEQLYTEDAASKLSGYPVNMEEQLVKAIRQGKADEAERAIGDILSAIAAKSATPAAAEASCKGLIHLLIRTIDEWEDAKDFRLEVEELLTNSYVTIERLEYELVRICRTLCDTLMMKKESHNFELRDNILSFIEAHYADNSLTLENIAARFGVSPSYITRFVKDQTGLPLIRYLGQVRMQKAKAMLRTTSFTVTEIAERIGYVDTMNFIRNFKKTEGVTPARYRELSSDKGSQIAGSEE
ncbi:helix-turn-helix domain-containing protein [Paenibacillus thalictri]|uniref:Helix-turn-helix domain-containing protein n=1 Tax=Paenibacillus thalictri TaxID=2527873 RepID=A0A4Q9DMB8_9BACL|nr:helix-turn-helix domain-containing protein [Paenibacillus thalictri]TBL74563.1 helix-turn-helix domain-containing protein [Paenibacillus thalictri]